MQAQIGAKPEEWRPVVSNPTMLVSSYGWVRNSSGEIAKQFLGKSGRLLVYCSRCRNRPVGLLVLEAFVGPRDPGQVVAYKDGNPLNNRLENLEYRRMHYATDRRGAKNSTAKLDEAKVRHLRAVYHQTGESLPALAARYGISTTTAYLAATGKTWAHVPMPDEYTR